MARSPRSGKSFQCQICGTKYRTEKSQKSCEGRTTEKQRFSVGDTVRNVEERYCQNNGKRYHFHGTVIAVLGPYKPDVEYETKWLGKKQGRLNGHVFKFEVEFTCPHCGEPMRDTYYGPELRRICSK